MPQTRFVVLFVGMILLAPSPTLADESDWGNLKARFVYNGEPPEREKIKLNSGNRAYCATFAPLDETLVVDKDGGLANVMFWLRALPNAPPAIHPSYAESADNKIVLDSRGCRFVPRALFLRTSETLRVQNSDATLHNAVLRSLENDGFNVLMDPEKVFEYRLKKPEPFPAKAWCGINPWRTADVMVLDHPYSAISASDGYLAIDNLPAGKWIFQAYHGKAGYFKNVEMRGEKVKWPRGRLELAIKPGENDLGVIKVSPAVFERK